MYQEQYAAPEALDIATVTKLVRNLCMVAVIPLVGVLYGGGRDAAGGKGNLLSLVPWFIVGFALMSALRTVGEVGDKALGIFEPATWAAIVATLRHAAELFLLVAMAAVGLTTQFAGLRRIGLKPFLLGLFAALLIGGVSLALVAMFADDMQRIVA